MIVTYAVGTRGNPLATGLVVGYFVFFESVGAVLLARAARSRVGYASTRLWIAAIGTVLFAATVLVAGIGGATAPPGAPLNAELTVPVPPARPLGGAVLPRGVHAAAAAAAAPAARHGVRLRTIAHRVARPRTRCALAGARRDGRAGRRRQGRGRCDRGPARRPSDRRHATRARSPSATRQPSAMPRSRVSRRASRCRSGPNRRLEP